MSEQTATAPYPRRAYGWYVVSLLILAYISSFIDRGILALMIGPIKAAMDLSDVQMSWLLGPAFGLFYATLGIPIAILADRYNRRNIIIIGSSRLAEVLYGRGRSEAPFFVFALSILGTLPFAIALPMASTAWPVPGSTASRCAYGLLLQGREHDSLLAVDRNLCHRPDWPDRIGAGPETLPGIGH